MDCGFEGGLQPQVLDIIEVPIMGHSLNLFQIENHLIDEQYYWEKVGTADIKLIRGMLDTPERLWAPHSSSFYGGRDRVQECDSGELKDSLYLIVPENMEILVRTEGEEFGNPKRKVRARFIYNNELYILPVTDPVTENEYLSRGEGVYPISISKHNISMCVSIGLPWKDYCYKFVASVIKQ